jgi:hypothetical protein
MSSKTQLEFVHANPRQVGSWDSGGFSGCIPRLPISAIIPKQRVRQSPLCECMIAESRTKMNYQIQYATILDARSRP